MALSRVRLFQPHGEGTRLLPQVIPGSRSSPTGPLTGHPTFPYPRVAARCIPGGLHRDGSGGPVGSESLGCSPADPRDERGGFGAEQGCVGWLQEAVTASGCGMEEHFRGAVSGSSVRAGIRAGGAALLLL